MRPEPDKDMGGWIAKRKTLSLAVTAITPTEIYWESHVFLKGNEGNAVAHLNPISQLLFVTDSPFPMNTQRKFALSRFTPRGDTDQDIGVQHVTSMQWPR